MRRAPRPIAAALDDFSAALAPLSTLARVQRLWRSTLGEVIAESAWPTAERDGVLTVTCTDSVWSAELEMMPELVERLNAALGKPTIIRLRCRTA